MSEEFTELQELLGNEPAQSQTHPSQPDALEREKEPTASEYRQWVVLPNETFMAAGATTSHLPVGAYIIDSTPAGLMFTAKNILTDTLIDFGNSNSLRVIEGIKLFWKRKQKFLDRGILYKRGILMWGPPGSGKTATLALLVQDLIANGGIVLLVQHPSLAVSGLRQLRKIEPDRPLIVILEDVEEIIRTYGEHDLLALLDGEHQTDNVVNIATTNYPELLGARIINRPSRFDEVVKIGMPSSAMREQYLHHLLRMDDIAGYNISIRAWVEATEGMSIAHLKELVVAVTCLEQPYEEVITRLKTMKSAPKSKMYETEPGFHSGQKAAQNSVSAVGGTSSSR
jgi:AAA+ superfamily predicted ATPase